MKPRQRSSLRVSRRAAMKTAAAGAVAIPVFVRSSALGLAGQVAASERLGLAFIGVGGRGTGLVSDIAKRNDVEILGICDVQRANRDRAVATMKTVRAGQKPDSSWRDCDLYRDFRDVLARDDVDGVVIAACEHWRPTLCIMAAEAGKDVYTEKPFALSINEGKAVFEAVRLHGRVLQHGTQHRNAGAFRRDCELVRSGRIGRVTHAETGVAMAPSIVDHVDYAQQSPPLGRDDFDWEMWLGPGPWRPWPGKPIGWQGLRDYGQGELGNLNAHGFDMLQWTLGKEQEGPVEILPADGEGPLTIRYADGIAIHCVRKAAGQPHGKGIWPGRAWWSLIHGTDGEKVIGWGGPPLKQLLGRDERYDQAPLSPDDVFMLPPHQRRGASTIDTQVGIWLESIRTRRPTNCNEEVAYRSSVLLCLVDIADQVQRPLKFDPVKAEFPGDAEANRLLDRPRRSPWNVIA